MIRRLLIGILWIYRYTLSPFLAFVGGPGSGCRFTPTCSCYAMEAIQKHGSLHGSLLGLRRICRCHPWGGFGFDPVPGKTDLPPTFTCMPSPARTQKTS